MKSNYDSQIQQLEQQAAAARRNEEELLATLTRLKQEIQESQAEIGRLEKEKQQIEFQADQNKPMQGQGYYDAARPDAQGHGQASAELNIKARIHKIDSQIKFLIDRINHLNGEISSINSHKLPQARQVLSDALSKLTQLKSQQAQLGREYQGAYRGVRQESSQVKLQEARSYMDQGAGIAQEQYRATKQRVNYIEKVLHTYGSPSTANSATRSTYCGQYVIKAQPNNNYSGLNGGSIDQIVSNYSAGNRNSVDGWYSSSVNSLTFSLFGGINGRPRYPSSIHDRYFKGNWSGLDY